MVVVRGDYMDGVVILGDLVDCKSHDGVVHDINHWRPTKSVSVPVLSAQSSQCVTTPSYLNSEAYIM